MKKKVYFLHICFFFLFHIASNSHYITANELKTIEEIIQSEEKVKSEEIKKALEDSKNDKDNLKDIFIKKYENIDDDKNNKNNNKKDDEKIESDLKGILNRKSDNNLPSLSVDNKNNDKKNLKDEKTILKDKDVLKKMNKNDEISEMQDGDIVNNDKIILNNKENGKTGNIKSNDKNDIKIEIITKKENQKDNKETNEVINVIEDNKKKDLTIEKNKKDIKQNNKSERNKNLFDKLFTIFDFQKAMDFDYNKIKYVNYGFLENIEERKILRQMIEKTYKENDDMQNNYEVNNENFVIKQKNTNNKKKIVIRENSILKVYSLVYFNDNDWKCKINKQIINNDNLYNIFNNSVSILKVNKGSITFMLRRTNKGVVDIVRDIQDKKKSYYYNYYIVNEKGKDYVVFTLFVGQKIDLRTMKISG